MQAAALGLQWLLPQEWLLGLCVKTLEVIVQWLPAVHTITSYSQC